MPRRTDGSTDCQVIGLVLSGERLGVRAMTQGALVEGASLVLTPVNSVRYWEFDFVDRILQQAGGIALDVSSPRLMSFYLAHRARFDRIDMANPDAKDLQVTGDLARVSGLSRVTCLEADALEASRGQPRYSAVWSISVVGTHPWRPGDSDAVRAMFNSLLPGGVLVITVPVDREAWDEYRTTDTYSLGRRGATEGTSSSGSMTRERSRIASSSRSESILNGWNGLANALGERSVRTSIAGSIADSRKPFPIPALSRETSGRFPHFRTCRGWGSAASHSRRHAWKVAQCQK